MKKLLCAAAIAVASSIALVACTADGGLELDGLGKYGELVDKISHGAQEGIETARESVSEVTTRYCGSVPLSVRRQARAIVNADPAAPQIVILCPGDPDHPGQLTMGLLATLGAWGQAAASALGLAKGRQDQLVRQELKQDGARAQQAEDLAADNEELRNDAEIYMRPDGSAEDVLDRLRARARKRVRKPADDE